MVESASLYHNSVKCYKASKSNGSESEKNEIRISTHFSVLPSMHLLLRPSVVCIYICMIVPLSISLSVYLSVCLSCILQEELQRLHATTRLLKRLILLFLDASACISKRGLVCLSVRMSVRTSVCPSVRMSVRPWVRPCRAKNWIGWNQRVEGTARQTKASWER